MSQITMTIVDSCRAIHAQPHGSFLDHVVAALSADPETIEELEAALARFIEPGERGPFDGWRAGVCDEPFEAGIGIVDLAARLVVAQSSYSSPGAEREPEYVADGQAIDMRPPYHLSDEWAFSDRIEGWQAMAERRKAERLAAPPLDARPVLYGKVCEFIVEECFAARSRTDSAAPSPWTPPEGWSLRELPERAQPDRAPTAEDAVAEIHARWLMTPREDLRGQSPRDVLLARTEHIALDEQDRGDQWSMLGKCPPGLSPRSTAFRLGGFGNNEVFLYYDMVRRLLWACWKSIVEPGRAGGSPTSEVSETSEVAAAKADQIQRLRQMEDQWLNAPQPEALAGRTPVEVIECERARLPIVISGEKAVADDVPWLPMPAARSGLRFLIVYGDNVEDDFPFSIYRTREEWEFVQRDWEEYQRFLQERERQRQAGLLDEGDWTGEGGCPLLGSPSCPGRSTHGRIRLKLFHVGMSVALLAVHLRPSPNTAPLADRLNHHFGNLRCAAGDPSAALVGPVVERFCEELVAVSETRTDLAAKCEAMERELRDLAAQLIEAQEGDDLPL